MGASIDPIETTQGATADVLAALETPAADGAPAETTAGGAAVETTTGTVEKRRRGRPPGARTGTGKRTRKKYDRTAARVPAETPAAPVASGEPMTAPVQDGPPPNTTRMPPAAEQVAYVAAFAGIAVVGLTSLAAKMTGNDAYKPTPDEMKIMPEAVARYYLHLNPNGIEDSPGMTVLLVFGMYYARASGLLGTMMAAAGVPTQPG